MCVVDRKVHASDDNSFVRINGWTLPLNFLQILTWTVYVYIGFLYFAVEALAVQKQWWPLSYISIGLLFIVHLGCLLAATSINPADDNSLYRIKHRKKPIPVFNRSEHAHVIENCYCHICEITVEKSSKHCSACNKCIAVFDHHCKWLNNCVGKKNYRIFLATLVTGIFGTLGMVAVSLFVFINSIQSFDSLYEETWWKTPSSLQVTFEVLIGIKILMLLTTLVLLVQLFYFHLILIYKDMTTLEFIRYDERRKQEKEQEKLRKAASKAEDTPVCSDVPTVVETTLNVSVPESEQVAVGQKEVAFLSRHPLMKFDGLQNDNGDHKKSNGSAVPPVKNGTLKNGDFSHDNPSYAPDTTIQYEIEQTISPISVNTNNSNNVEAFVHADGENHLPNEIPDTSSTQGQKTKLQPRHNHKRKRRKRASYEKSVNPPRPLPNPLPTLIESPNSSYVHLRNIHLPPVRDSVEWVSSTEDLTKGAMKGKKLPPLSNSSSLASIADYSSEV